jgi:hypothetical protein
MQKAIGGIDNQSLITGFSIKCIGEWGKGKGENK